MCQSHVLFAAFGDCLITVLETPFEDSSLQDLVLGSSLFTDKFLAGAWFPLFLAECKADRRMVGLTMVGTVGRGGGGEIVEEFAC